MSDTINTPPTKNELPPQSQSEMQKEEDERRRRGGFFWWWRIATGLLLAAAVLGGGLYYGGYLGKRFADKQKIENAYVFRIDGQDGQGRKAVFDFIVLTDQYTWVKGSSNQVISGDRVIAEEDVAERVITPGIRNSLSHSPDLIAVGLASSEGNRAQEEERASQRAQSVSAWLEKLAEPPTKIWALSLGQYDKQCKQQEDKDTSFERPLIMVAVRSKVDGMNLQQALANAISSVANLPDRNCYSRFDLSKTR